MMPPQFNKLALHHARRWIHEGLHYKKLNPPSLTELILLKAQRQANGEITAEHLQNIERRRLSLIAAPEFINIFHAAHLQGEDLAGMNALKIS